MTWRQLVLIGVTLSILVAAVAIQRNYDPGEIFISFGLRVVQTPSQ